MLVTPTMMSLRALGVDDIVRTAENGAARELGQHPSSELPLHLAAYRARPDVRAVIHTHPTFCVVCSKLGRVFARDTVGARETLGEVAWTPYRPPGSLELAQVAAEQFGRGCDVVLMERHGVSVVGPTLEAAFLSTDLAEEAARIAFYSSLLPLGRQTGPGHPT